MQALKIIADLHSRGLVLGIVRSKSFVVDASGTLFLSGFETMRVEDPSVPFRPISGASVGEMAFMAPELLDSLRNDGPVALARETDMYSIGCFAYEVSLVSKLLQAGRDSFTL